MAQCVQFVRQSVGTSPSSYCGRTDLLLFNGLQTKRFIGDTSSVAHRLHLKFSISSQPSELGNNRSRQHVWSLSYSWWCWACYNKYFCTHLGVTFFSWVRVAQHSGSFILAWKCLSPCWSQGWHLLLKQNTTWQMFGVKKQKAQWKYEILTFLWGHLISRKRQIKCHKETDEWQSACFFWNRKYC